MSDVEGRKEKRLSAGRDEANLDERIFGVSIVLVFIMLLGVNAVTAMIYMVLLGIRAFLVCNFDFVVQTVFGIVLIIVLSILYSARSKTLYTIAAIFTSCNALLFFVYLVHLIILLTVGIEDNELTIDSETIIFLFIWETYVVITYSFFTFVLCKLGWFGRRVPIQAESPKQPGATPKQSITGSQSRAHSPGSRSHE
ncbi:unnamed protein product [Caenorhabditis bovis]|uniref:Uncharacterized protein n=1 Tax=Caenorhabditis bovis TaxID=2654633 RepID=A0A8S1EVX5_9PELO|nr:unnamed protein product [Caenorhabditis bovis]